MEYVVGKFHGRYGVKGYNTLLTGGKKITEDDTDKTKHEGVIVLEFLKKTAYNDVIVAKYYMVCFHIAEEAKT